MDKLEQLLYNKLMRVEGTAEWHAVNKAKATVKEAYLAHKKALQDEKKAIKAEYNKNKETLPQRALEILEDMKKVYRMSEEAQEAYDKAYAECRLLREQLVKPRRDFEILMLNFGRSNADKQNSLREGLRVAREKLDGLESALATSQKKYDALHRECTELYAEEDKSKEKAFELYLAMRRICAEL